MSSNLPSHLSHCKLQNLNPARLKNLAGCLNYLAKTINSGTPTSFICVPEIFATSLEIRAFAVYNIHVYLYSLPVLPFSGGKV